MFKEDREETTFEWNMIGNIEMGRPQLGTTMEIAVYRLMQFTLRDVLIKRFDPETADKIFYEAGKLAGQEFCKNLIDKSLDFDGFVTTCMEKLAELKIGILRVEKADLSTMTFTLTVAEDLDCSGLPVTDEEICIYDEGFIAGLFREYTGKEFHVREIDCWCSGDRVCRFEVHPREILA